MKRSIALSMLALGLGACGSDDAEKGLGESTATLLGDTSEAPRVTTIADRFDRLLTPRDLAFHPGREGELWIVNRADDSVTIVFDATREGKEKTWLQDPAGNHFMEEVSSIAFGDRLFNDDYNFATCQESQNTYDGQAAPNLFMGPALWTSDLSVFALRNPDAFGGELGSHLDMLHHSPDCMGIAHETANAYWVFDGYNGQIVRYDFQEDHGPGFDDHSDGVITFLDQPKVARVPDVPSHMEYDKEANILYVADSGNGRVLWIDAKSGKDPRPIDPIEPGTKVEELTDVSWGELIPKGVVELPSGLLLHEGILYVGDNAKGEIVAFDLAADRVVARLQTAVKPGGLMGLEVGPDNLLYFVDAATNRVFRLER